MSRIGRYELGALLGEGGAGRVYRADIHHAPWPLQAVDAEIDHNTMAAAAGLPLAGPPARLAFARRLDVVVWPPARLGAGHRSVYR